MASLISKPKAAHLGESFTESTQNGEDIPTEYLQNDNIQRLEADIAILVI
jgi:adenine specific DNA methylase Mod